MRESSNNGGGTATATAPSSTPDARVSPSGRKTEERASPSYLRRLARLTELERFAHCSDRD